ncbi:Mitochondrial chaperone BCS1 [Pseudocercospora fuligena]|uniref:Mitochondrial chaperone BCS1 n=1 Tax=Pseudocercospora fuligena TaxID=685502 RepID=A0A8H6VBM6_9PEZI|nr:Mitochondrial chaperone BCS1 [Pseudocercospora fuligena]
MSRSKLPQAPLTALRTGLVSIATGLRTASKTNLDIVDLTTSIAWRNAVSVIRQASPLAAFLINTFGPFAVLAFGFYKYVLKGMNVIAALYSLYARFYASIKVPTNHALNRQVTCWLAKRSAGPADSRSLTLNSTRCYDPNVRDRYALNYLSAKTSSWYKFDGRWFRFDRAQPQLEYSQDDHSSRKILSTIDPEITISCFSMSGSTQPIKDLLKHIQDSFKPEAETMIFRVAKDGNGWSDPVWRAARNMDSLAMEPAKKADIIGDIATYLDPKSKAYYLDRGIPYRRGYLLFGPPGTGKTSFSTALAGHFNLPLYMLSFTNPKLTDSGLDTLFEDLPPRSIIVMEDVDSAGIQREVMTDKSDPKSKKESVTLSGLLNAIDGPASVEGRVLILTSNSPDSLDPALIRPGRCDRKILMGHASRQVAALLFKKTFTNVDGNGIDNLDTLSETFAASLPEDSLSPAEIQNFLLTHRDAPSKAIELAAEWSAGVLAIKANGSNVASFSGNIDSSSGPADASGGAKDTESDVASDKNIGK